MLQWYCPVQDAPFYIITFSNVADSTVKKILSNQIAYVRRIVVYILERTQAPMITPEVTTLSLCFDCHLFFGVAQDRPIKR